MYVYEELEYIDQYKTIHVYMYRLNFHKLYSMASCFTEQHCQNIEMMDLHKKKKKRKEEDLIEY